MKNCPMNLTQVYLTSYQPTGNLEMMKTILASGSEDKDLELDRPTANGSYFALHLLQATLLVSATIEATQAQATAIQTESKPANRLSLIASPVLQDLPRSRELLRTA